MTLTPQQVEERKRGVGGSEMLAALGKDPRCSRLELYMRKVGELPDLDFSDNERVHFGNVLEPVVRDEMARRLGHKIIVPHQTLHHPSAPIVAHPDGWIPATGEGVECKTADRFEADEFGEPGSDQVPVRYLVQCATYMAVTDAPKWHLGVLIGGNDFRMYEIPRDPAIEAAVIEGARAFWTHVEQRRPPAAATPDDVKLLWPKSLGRSVTATPEIEQLCGELAVVKLLLKETELREGSLKMEIQRFMEDASELVDARGKTLATWRTNKSSKVFNTTKFAEDNPALHADYLIERPGARPFLLKK